MFRRLFTPRWLGALALAVVAAFVCFELGQWQYGRHVYKSERNARLDANYGAAPRPVGDVITADPLAIARQWTRVSAVGRYAAGGHLYVRNRPNDSTYGYEVLAPFQLADGRTVVVDRGWVENSPSGADVLPEVPPMPVGEVTLTGWALPGEASRGRGQRAGQLASINLAEAGRAWGVEVLGGYVLLQEERTSDGAVADRPQPLARPDRSLGPHQAYAFQWWLTMPLGLVLLWFGIRRELRMEAEAAGGVPVGAGAATRAPRPPKPKKVRIWDEEDA